MKTTVTLLATALLGLSVVTSARADGGGGGGETRSAPQKAADPDYASAVKAIEAGQFAYRDLKSAIETFEKTGKAPTAEK